MAALPSGARQLSFIAPSSGVDKRGVDVRTEGGLGEPFRETMETMRALAHPPRFRLKARESHSPAGAVIHITAKQLPILIIVHRAIVRRSHHMRLTDPTLFGCTRNYLTQPA